MDVGWSAKGFAICSEIGLSWANQSVRILVGKDRIVITKSLINTTPFEPRGMFLFRQNVKASSLFVFSDSPCFPCSKLLTSFYFQAIKTFWDILTFQVNFLPFSLCDMLRVASLFREVQVVWAPRNETLEFRHGRVESWTLEFGSFGIFEQDDLVKKSWLWSDRLIGWPSAF